MLREPWGIGGPSLGGSFSQEPFHRSRYSVNRFRRVLALFLQFWPFLPFRQSCPPGPGTSARYEVKYLVHVIVYYLLYKVSKNYFCELVKLPERGNYCP